MSEYTEPRVCLRCKEIETFCSCGKRSVYDLHEYVKELEQEIAEAIQNYTSQLGIMRLQREKINQLEIDKQNMIDRGDSWREMCDELEERWTIALKGKQEALAKLEEHRRKIGQALIFGVNEEQDPVDVMLAFFHSMREERDSLRERWRLAMDRLKNRFGDTLALQVGEIEAIIDGLEGNE